LLEKDHYAADTWLLTMVALILADDTHIGMVDGQPQFPLDGTEQVSATQKRTAVGMSPPETILGSRQIEGAH
jgi:hypothetical protein